MKKIYILIFLFIPALAFPHVFNDLCKTGTLDEIVTAIEEGVDVNEKTEAGYTPLMFAAGLNPDPEVTLALIAAGADVNMCSDKGFTAWQPDDRSLFYGRLSRCTGL